MSQLNIFSIENLSKRSWIPQDLLLSWIKLDNHARKCYFYDHKDSDTKKQKYIRVTKNGTMMKQFHVWLGSELKKFDSELLFTINGGVSQKSILNAINVHIRKEPFTFIKSDLSRFFESIPRERVFTLFCSRLNCSKDVAEIITNCITFPEWPLWTEWPKNTLARWLHVSSRVAIWCSIQFFRELHKDLLKKYKNFSPKVSYYVDDIGVSLLTTNQEVIDSFLKDLEVFSKKEYGGINFLKLHPEKTQYQILKNSNDSVEYLGSRIYLNRKDVSIKWIEKSKNTYFLLQKTKDPEERKKLYIRLKAYKQFRKQIKSNPKNHNK